METNILNELDLALEDLRAARERLGQLLPPSAGAGEKELRANAAAWEQAQRALREITILVCHYAGWPIGSRVNQVVEESISRASQS